jgi:septum formation protein
LFLVDDSSPLILASTSPYRRELLARLKLSFEIVKPEVAEEYRKGEPPVNRALRLALEKAEAVAARFPSAVVIGSDQVAAVGDAILDKPGSAESAQAQLKVLSGREARFYTACVVIGRQRFTHLATTLAVFRKLSEAEIARYVNAEPAFDCAGGAKVEGLGISLVERIESDDPTALIGLPLIWLASALRNAGYRVP